MDSPRGLVAADVLARSRTLPEPPPGMIWAIPLAAIPREALDAVTSWGWVALDGPAARSAAAVDRSAGINATGTSAAPGVAATISSPGEIASGVNGLGITGPPSSAVPGLNSTAVAGPPEEAAATPARPAGRRGRPDKK